MKKQIGVIFGSRSCEREVAIISAVQLMRYADCEKYDIIPVYIDEQGSWYTGECLKDIQSYKPFRPEGFSGSFQRKRGAALREQGQRAAGAGKDRDCGAD